MASPLREARDWRAQDRDAEPKATGTAGAASSRDKSNVAKPAGDLLVMVKGDLTDHRPWLESQFAAIQAGRERHERRLASQRQEEAVKEAATDPDVQPQEIAELPPNDAATRLRATLDPYLAKLPAGLTVGAARIGERLSRGVAWAAAKSRAAWSSMLAWSKAKAETLAPTISDWIATAGERTTRAANAAAASAAPLVGKMQAVLRRSAGRASSLLAQIGVTGRRQRLILAGALIGGALALGSLLLLRADAPTMEAAPIVWSFEASSRTPDNATVFTLSGTPAQFRIDGLAFRGENSLDHPLTGVEAVVKADKLHHDLRLALEIDGTPVLSGEPHAVEVPLVPAKAASDDVIPGSAPFELVADFPGEGVSAEEFFEVYGGLTLTMRYTAEGKQRTLIQYLSPEMLKAQLADILAMGS